MYVDRGRLAQLDHDRKLKEYLRKDLNTLIQRQKLVKDGKVKTNFSILDLPTLKYGKPEKEVLASGSGRGKDKQPSQGKGQQGQGETVEVVDLSGMHGADDHADPDTVELDFEEFVRLAQEQLIDELSLPPLSPHRMTGDALTAQTTDLMDEDRQGLMADLNLETTMVESLKRNIRERGKAEYEVDVKQDGWYFTEVPEDEKSNRVLEVYVLDISGSVSGHNIALIRKFIFILWYYLDKKYSTNARRYIVFQDEAEDVQRETFFSIESKGGTHISAGLCKSLAALDGFDQYDKFLFFFSDGDNSSSDEEKAKEALDDVLKRFDLVCYGRINPCDSQLSPFNKLVKERAAEHTNLSFADIKDLENVKTTIGMFLKLIES